MIIYITGILLIPGKLGADCPGNGTHLDRMGNVIECCCDECDYMICCFENHDMEMCKSCSDGDCPNAPKPFPFVSTY